MSQVISDTIHVLLIEESAGKVGSWIAPLEREGIETDCRRIETADSLREILAGGSWDVVLWDDRVAIVDPEAALEIVRDMDLLVPVIILTENIGVESAADLMRAGAADLVLRQNSARLAAAIHREARRSKSDGTADERCGGPVSVTECRRTQKALRLSDERFDAFMNNSPALAWITDAEGRFLFANASLIRNRRVAGEAVVGRTIGELFPADYAAICLESIRTVLKTGQALESIEPAVRPDGEVAELLVHRFPVPDPAGLPAVGGIAVDVSELQQMKATLELRDRAINAATQGIVITDPNQPDNPIVYVNSGFERLTGYSSQEILGRNCRFLQGPDTDPRLQARIRVSLKTGDPCCVEILNYRKDGTPFWNQLSISPVRDAHGRLTHFVGVQNEITRRKHLEEQFQQAQKMEAVGQLAGGIAHDFNNLLTVINGYARALLEMVAPEDPFWEPLHEICQAGERSANLTRQLLAFSRRQFLSLEILDLNTVVLGAEKLLKRLIAEDIELVTLLSPGPLPVKADAGQIEQILLNLAVNARDAMPNGGQLTVETQTVVFSEEQCRVHPGVRPGTYIMVSVADTGCGISPAVQSRIFEPFFTTKKEAGTGLGLSVVHGIVKQLGGHLKLDSEVGIGTMFKILLPRESAELPAQDDVKTRSPSLPRGTETILLVEDEPGVRRFAKQVLEKCGYIVLDAEDGAAAIRLLQSFERTFNLKIHLLVTDVVMPDESGPQVAERMFKDHPDLKVIFISGYTDDAVLRHGMANREVSYLQKPFTAFELAKKVRTVLNEE